MSNKGPLVLLPGHRCDHRMWTLLSRGAGPGEIAAAVMFLLGPDVSFITGADLSVDGGVIGGGI